MMSIVFAPYCSTCGRRVLLGCEDIVRFTADGAAGHVVVLRCTCGELVEWDQRPPEASLRGRDFTAAGHDDEVLWLL